MKKLLINQYRSSIPRVNLFRHCKASAFSSCPIVTDRSHTFRRTICLSILELQPCQSPWYRARGESRSVAKYASRSCSAAEEGRPSPSKAGDWECESGTSPWLTCYRTTSRIGQGGDGIDCEGRYHSSHGCSSWSIQTSCGSCLDDFVKQARGSHPWFWQLLRLWYHGTTSGSWISQ